MPSEEGYIKFQIDWEESDRLSVEKIKEINHWRQWLHTRNLIGVYPDGVAYGNISSRSEKTGLFLISGTQTGGLIQLDTRHYTIVTSYDIDNNYLACVGPIKASSESMTHAAIYACRKDINTVIHIHQKQLWQKLIHKAQTTPKKAAYGTPAMAKAIQKLLLQETNSYGNLIVMAGHEDGLITYGREFQEAIEVINTLS